MGAQESSTRDSHADYPSAAAPAAAAPERPAQPKRANTFSWHGESGGFDAIDFTSAFSAEKWRGELAEAEVKLAEDKRRFLAELERVRSENVGRERGIREGFEEEIVALEAQTKTLEAQTKTLETANQALETANAGLLEGKLALETELEQLNADHQARQVTQKQDHALELLARVQRSQIERRRRERRTVGREHRDFQRRRRARDSNDGRPDGRVVAAEDRR